MHLVQVSSLDRVEGHNQMNWSRGVLGVFWATVGGYAVVESLLGLWTISKNPAVSCDLLPSFLLFFFLAFGVFLAANAYALLARKPAARWMTIAISALLTLVSGGLLIYREWLVFTYMPTALCSPVAYMGCGLWSRGSPSNSLQLPVHRTPSQPQPSNLVKLY